MVLHASFFLCAVDHTLRHGFLRFSRMRTRLVILGFLRKSKFPNVKGEWKYLFLMRFKFDVDDAEVKKKRELLY